MSDQGSETLDLQSCFEHLDSTPHSSFGVAGWLSEGINTAFGQSPRGPTPGSTTSSTNYGPVAQPFLPQPQHSTYSQAFSVIYDPRDMRPLPEGVYFVNKSEVQVPVDFMEIEQATCFPDGDIDIEGVDDDLEVSKDFQSTTFASYRKNTLSSYPE
ncbi:hypothetical protein BDR07DRAFT_1484066 [Suillus spraguei]|nr:hypothetical protein BDR07DRAFT_1484066 [Suillus spraguei]